MKSAIEENFVEERHLWQDIVAIKDAIIANKEAALGASLKDLGKKWFAFSKMDAGADGVGGALMAKVAGV